MPFSEPTKQTVKQQADFTCCWCQDLKNKVEVHHIIPEAEGGPDSEDNAAPLCSNCHTLYGGNPDLRKEIRERRDHWYSICSMKYQFSWPIGLDVPLLGFYREILPSDSIATEGIQFTDKEPDNHSNPPLLYLSVYFKTSRFFGKNLPPSNERWLYLQADMRFAFRLQVQVRAWNERDVLGLMGFLTDYEDKYFPGFPSAELLKQSLESEGRGWDLHGPRPENSKHGSGDYFCVWRENDEKRLVISTFTPTNAGVSIHARFSNDVAKAFVTYLEDVGFAKPFR